MLSAIRRRLTFANLAVILVLVFAMTGGAYAASRYIITSTKQIKPSVLKQIEGKVRATGKEGPAGPAGKEGAAGKNGSSGVSGEKGSQGEKGEKGEKGETGEKGANGVTGFTTTLPSGKSETGNWVLAGEPVEKFSGPHVWGSVSFNIPLKEVPAHVVVVPAPTQEQIEKQEIPAPPAGCAGNIVEEPKAEPGNFCLFARREENVGMSEPGVPNYEFFSPEAGGELAAAIKASGKKGVLIAVTQGEEAGPVFAAGVWVVTAN